MLQMHSDRAELVDGDIPDLYFTRSATDDCVELTCIIFHTPPFSPNKEEQLGGVRKDTSLSLFAPSQKRS